MGKNNLYRIDPDHDWKEVVQPSDLFQQLVRHLLALQLLEELLPELLQAGERPLGRQLGAADLLLGVAVQRDVEVEAGRWFGTCRLKLQKIF